MLVPSGHNDPFLSGSPSIGRTGNEDRQLDQQPGDMGLPGYSRQPRALGELQQNGQDQTPRSPTKERGNDGRRSPQKSGFATISLKSKLTKSRDPSPVKPKKAKSATNLGGLLRPKSVKNLKQLVDDEETRRAKDKENRTPPSSMATEMAPPPPIFAQFTSQPLSQHSSSPASPELDLSDPFGRRTTDTKPKATEFPVQDGQAVKQRPKSFQPPTSKPPRSEQKPSKDSSDSRADHGTTERSQKRMTWGKGSGAVKQSPARPTVLNAFPGLGSRTKSASSDMSNTETVIDPKDIDKHLEAMLDRRNIPENQRYKMRNLNDTIKMEFIRQDWAETQAKELTRPSTNESGTSVDDRKGEAGTPGVSEQDDGKKKKKERPLSFTLAKRASKDKGLASPTKKSKGEGTIGRHFRTKSNESVISDRPSSSEASASGGIGGGLFAKVKGQQGPGDFVSYLRKVQKPELVEVGKLHKLRLLLRNETVAWTEEFIRQGGMKEIVGLLHRIMDIEWREEHEDALLHENLLCLKALCTTALALQYLHSIHEVLFPALLHMIFDPEKKGPSEFTTRAIITSVLFTYLEAAGPVERVARAQTLLKFLRDPEAKEEERPVEFVLEMRRERPYRVWNKEVVGVTKEVFWIFLHHLNVVSLPSDRKPAAIDKDGNASPGSDPDGRFAYMARHFPQERPPVPAAPYVGGVEWDATNYMASHLDLVNAILACSGPTAADRNALRAQLRISGWERCLGGSLRLCKEKFYGAVHDGLRTWVAAAVEDGWDVRDVRYGPPPSESRSASPAKRANGGKKKDGAGDEAPKIEMPKLDFTANMDGKGGEVKSNEPWLS
ncbi:hypothetical protein GQ53DRAFT_638433 [Thozetella sp. PMI_491]|nr:hypothetical protein GQ53DRAFT_638433 [Thozetella sp. PMI_491]